VARPLRRSSFGVITTSKRVPLHQFFRPPAGSSTLEVAALDINPHVVTVMVPHGRPSARSTISG